MKKEDIKWFLLCLVVVALGGLLRVQQMGEQRMKGYKHVKCKCGGIIGMYDNKTFTCERCKKEYELSKQLLRCGTSIGANVAESERGQSKADFNAKLNIALKEANETDYWLELFFESEIIDQLMYKSLHDDLNEIIALLISSIKTTKTKDK